MINAMMSLRNWIVGLVLVTATVISSPAASGDKSDAKRSEDPFFGFTGPETFPIDPFVSELRAADFDGDGLIDLMVVNNSRSKINILYNRTGKTNDVADLDATRRDLNDLPPDARFRIDSIASEKRIASLIVADLNGDKRPDIAY